MAAILASMASTDLPFLRSFFLVAQWSLILATQVALRSGVESSLMSVEEKT